jgi:hypothetical protein
VGVVGRDRAEAGDEVHETLLVVQVAGEGGVGAQLVGDRHLAVGGCGRAAGDVARWVDDERHPPVVHEVAAVAQ